MFSPPSALRAFGVAALCGLLAASCLAGRTAPAGPTADHRVLNDRSAELNSAGRFSEALAAAKQAIEARPDYAFAWNNRAVALLGLGRPEEALAAAERSLALMPENALAWSNLSVALRLLGRLDDAVEAAERALQLDPRNAVIWFNKACYLALRGSREAALGSLATALRLDPGLKQAAAAERELMSLRDDPEFRLLVD